MNLTWVMLFASCSAIRLSGKIGAFAFTASTATASSTFLFRNNNKKTSFPRRWMTTTAKTAAATSSADEALRGLVRVPVATAVRHHGSRNVRFLDGSWWLGEAERGRLDFIRGPRIEGAHFLDIDDICCSHDDNPKGLPHMMPPPDLMARAMDWFGAISNGDHVVVYGQRGCPFGVHRAYFQLWALGHDLDRLHLLDGSLRDWIDAGGPVDRKAGVPTVHARDLLSTSSSSAAAATPPSYRAAPARNVVDMDEMKRLVALGRGEDTGNGSAAFAATIVDVRSPDRYRGRVDEPRPGLRRGHMPGSRNLFFQDLLDPADPARLLPRDQLRTRLRPLLDDCNNNGNSNKSNGRIIATCGSGATACTLAAALIDVGVDPRRVWIYDGSWAEWGADPDVPIVTGTTEDEQEQGRK